jgi:hypothetical protein
LYHPDGEVRQRQLAQRLGEGALRGAFTAVRRRRGKWSILLLQQTTIEVMKQRFFEQSLMKNAQNCQHNGVWLIPLRDESYFEVKKICAETNEKNVSTDSYNPP